MLALIQKHVGNGEAIYGAGVSEGSGAQDVKVAAEPWLTQ